MRIDILTLFPDMFQGPFSESMLKRARDRGLLDIRLHNIRDHAQNKHLKTDDYPFGGGAGLVMGNSFLFPGTYKRSYSFRNGALRGIKIVTGLIPFFIIAGWIESFITRYADTYPVVGAAAIILSLGGVIGYFVVYPYYLHKTETNGKD